RDVLARLDALGHHLDAERAADVDDRSDQPALALGDDDGGDELAVDLEPARAELEQRDDGSVAGAEIVDLDADAQILELLDVEGDDVVALVEIDRFHQLERIAPTRQVQRLEARDQPLVVQAAR